ncbi:DUF2721 domain-containing protein [Pyrinomonas methylaliphatogenes]|uniref:DUF2721 domain-containing protein n=1 Tax=Pyrinomonas methylaliphatogenes TaxID=454194 RepID=A0A0B6WZX4_9BACT|nr:DUF2721 domain-containing protein [Pyrinomonas methylaliphatogenes]CDM66611.1 Protein of unknown function (DUF2721) [Pyrinomonas methylaliphatogenes]
MKMETLSSALAVLTAMITPAVLISACGTLILSTSTRLGRVVDRVRGLSERFEELARSEEREAIRLRRGWGGWSIACADCRRGSKSWREAKSERPCWKNGVR